MYIDPFYWYFALPGIILTILAQIYVKIVFSKYSKKDSGREITGLETAQLLAEREDFPVTITTNQGDLNDHFDPIRDIVGISRSNTTSSSISNIAVVAHEFGHVEQKFSDSLIYKIRRIIVPVTEFGTKIGYVLFVIGIIISALRLSEIGLVFFSTSVLFSLIALPLEFDASKRAMIFIEKYDLIAPQERGGAKSVLNAAALTYVAGLLTSILNLMYYISILNRRR